MRKNRVICFLILCLLAAASTSGTEVPEPIPIRGEVRVNTDYSSIIIRDYYSVRYLYFIRDSGERVIQSAINLRAPHMLVLPYTQRMFASYLFVHEPQNVLIVGLGGGAMVRFLQHYEPELKVTAIDIDPEVIMIARDYFGAYESKTVKFIAVDGFDFLRRDIERFDVIYMDAFLNPSDQTDVIGVPLAMKSDEFYSNVKERLTDKGVVVFNLNWHPGVAKDVAEIRRSFPNGFVFGDPVDNFQVIVAMKSQDAPDVESLVRSGARAEERLGGALSFRSFVDELRMSWRLGNESGNMK